MGTLCNEIRQRHSEQTQVDQWLHVINFLNEALVTRIHSKGIPSNLSPQMYGLKAFDYRDARRAAQIRRVNLAGLFVMTRELDLVESLDGILVRRLATLSPRKTQSVRSTDVSIHLSSVRHQKPVQRDQNPSPAPPAPTTASAPQLRNTYFNVPMFSDLTVVLRDRSVYVSRIMLCRVSGNFASLLQDSCQVC